MIINFSVRNFGSIKEKQTLSFEADKSTHLEDAYVVKVSGLRILKLALIYGANASGKTTILKALDFLRNLVLEPESKKTKELDFQPYLFDPDTPKQNTLISLEFLQEGIRYFYEVEFFRSAVVAEALYFYSPNKANVFKRKTNLENQFTEIRFGSKILIDKTFEKTLEANTLWNNTVLGGYLKTNIDIKELQPVLAWFNEYHNPLISTRTSLEEFTTTKIHKNEISKADVLAILQKADLNISDIVLEEKEEEVPLGFIEFLKKQTDLPTDVIKALEINSKINSLNVALEHKVKDTAYTLPFEWESQGTKRYYGFAGLLALLIKGSEVFCIDELEASLHPDLFEHFLLSFLLNAKHSQLIATTHNREILDNKDLFRNDAIWFTDKPDGCATELYSLADFDSATIRNTTNILNAYKSGKLNGTPNLGDTFIDLNP